MLSHARSFEVDAAEKVEVKIKCGVHELLNHPIAAQQAAQGDAKEHCRRCIVKALDILSTINPDAKLTPDIEYAIEQAEDLPGQSSSGAPQQGQLQTRTFSSLEDSLVEYFANNNTAKNEGRVAIVTGTQDGTKRATPEETKSAKSKTAILHALYVHSPNKLEQIMLLGIITTLESAQSAERSFYQLFKKKQAVLANLKQIYEQERVEKLSEDGSIEWYDAKETVAGYDQEKEDEWRMRSG